MTLARTSLPEALLNVQVSPAGWVLMVIAYAPPEVTGLYIVNVVASGFTAVASAPLFKRTSPDSVYTVTALPIE